MANKPTITREAILEAAYARAQADGVASLGVRTIANDCNVSVGTIYNYFPDKAALVTDVVARFWQAAIQDAGVMGAVSEAAEADGVVAYCRRLSKSLSVSLQSFRASWLREISSLDARTRQRTHAAEAACFGSIRDDIERAIQADRSITPEARERLDAQELATYIWRALFEAIKTGDTQTETLFSLLELALYR